MHARVRGAVALALALAGVLPLSSPRALALNAALDVSQYAHTAWKVRDGFIQGAIGAIAQTPDGYLWLGTEFGLVRFDGVRPVAWQPPAGERLPSNDIGSLLVARDGTLWIATRKGLASWKGGKLTNYPEVAGQVVFSLLEDREGTVWFGASAPGKLCAIESGKVQCYGAGSFGNFVSAVYEDSGGKLWVSAQTGVWRWKPSPPEHYTLPGDLYADALIEGNGGALLLATVRGLKQLVGGKIQNYALPGVTGQFRPNRFFQGGDGSLWIGSWQGLLHLHDGRTDTFGVDDGLSANVVSCIFEDREENVWVGTLDGLDRFREYAVQTISLNQGLSNSFASSVQATPNGSIWLAADRLNRWENEHVTVYGGRRGPGQSGRRNEQGFNIRGGVTEIANNRLAGAPRSLGLDDQGRLWVSTSEGVFYFEGGRFTRVPGVPGGNVYSIIADRQGNVWISNGNLGLFCLTPGGAVQQIPWTRFGQKPFGAGVLLPDRLEAGVWLGFLDGGIAYLKDGQVRASYTAANGLGNGRVNDLRFGSRGTLWAATEGGLSRIRNGHVATLTSKNGLPCDAVHWSIEDDDHFVWASMPCGLARVARSELDAWVSNPGHKLQFKVFDRSDGVRGVGDYGGYGPHVTKAPDGRIWFVHRDGVSVIDPRQLPYNRLPPPVHIEQIVADRKTHEAGSDANGNLRLPPLIHDLQIDYTALSLVAPEKIRFRYKLEGLDRDWQDAGNRRQAFYSDLPPRHYRFRVVARNNSGVWNETGASLDFSVAPAYYQTVWFRATCVAILLAVLLGLYQLGLHQLRRQLEARVDERKRIAGELHDTLLQNLHGLMFRFQAARNMLPRRPEEAMEALDGAIMRTEQAIAESQDAIADLRSAPDGQSDLGGLLTATGKELQTTGHANGTPPAFELIVEGERRTLSPILQDEVYRIARELLRNSFRHACAHRVEAEVQYAHEQLRVRIRDDGKGMDPDVLKQGRRQGHWGLPGVKERAQRIGAQLDFWSEAGAGTEVQLSVPAAIAYKNSHDRPRFKFFRRVRVDGQRL